MIDHETCECRSRSNESLLLIQCTCNLCIVIQDPFLHHIKVFFKLILEIFWEVLHMVALVTFLDHEDHHVTLVLALGLLYC